MHKTCTGIKKNKKKKLWASTQGWGSIDHKSFVFFCLFWCLCRFCEDHALFFLFFLVPVHVWWRLESQNLHRHQKKQKHQTTRCTKPAQASKKPKKTKLWASTQGWGSIDHKSFFFWCLCRFCEDHALFFLFSLMPVHVWWRLESQNLHRHQKNQKNQTTRCTKPAQASKKPKKTKLWASTQGWGSIDHKSFFFVFFDACAGFVKIMLCFFVFFDACAGFVKIMLSFVCFSQCLRMFCQSLPRWKNEKACVSPAFQTLQVHKTL